MVNGSVQCRFGRFAPLVLSWELVGMGLGNAWREAHAREESIPYLLNAHSLYGSSVASWQNFGVSPVTSQLTEETIVERIFSFGYNAYGGSIS